jgi:hypothetical protein
MAKSFRRLRKCSRAAFHSKKYLVTKPLSEFRTCPLLGPPPRGAGAERWGFGRFVVEVYVVFLVAAFLELRLVLTSTR